MSADNRVWLSYAILPLVDLNPGGKQYSKNGGNNLAIGATYRE